MQTHLRSISAITLAISSMSKAYRFYEALGFEPNYGGENADFSSFKVGENFLNLDLGTERGDRPFWGRVIFYVDDVDAMYRQVLELGLEPETEPRDAEWHERYFHLLDPDGNELSFAKPIE